jgi:pilus assembly protein CpaD
MSKDLMRLAALSAVLLAGSCATPGSNDPVPTVEPQIAYPITVQPDYQAVKLSFGGPGAPMASEDIAKLDHVVQDYLTQGDGSLSVSAPEGPDSSEAITFFGERLAQMGVARSRILVGTHPVTDGDRRVEIGFVSYVAHTRPCGDWSKNANNDDSNLPMPDFGCSVQHNVAAMVANPRDLDQPRRFDDGPDAVRRATVMGHYEKGEVTQADKHSVDKATEQSGISSDVQ